jgi:hypothetical protein
MRFLWTIILPCVLFIVMAGCSGSSDGSKPIKGIHTVKYEVSTSTQDVSIIYLDENGETVSIPRKDTHTSSSWTYLFESKDGAHLSLSAQLLDDGPDTVYVAIYVDGSEFQEHSYGEKVSALREYDIPITD